MTKGTEAVEIFKLAKAKKLLPVKMEELVPLSFIGTTAVKFYRDKLKLMDQLDMTEEQRKITLRDGQEAGELLLDIEARIGEIYNKAEPAKGGPKKQNNHSTGPGKIKTKKDMVKLTGGKDKAAYDRFGAAAKIAANPEAVEAIKAEAKAHNDIPTKTAVLNKIQLEKERKLRKKAEANKKKNQRRRTAEQITYITALDKCLLALPAKPPSDWEGEALKEAGQKAGIIIKRLAYFSVLEPFKKIIITLLKGGNDAKKIK